VPDPQNRPPTVGDFPGQPTVLIHARAEIHDPLARDDRRRWRWAAATQPPDLYLGFDAARRKPRCGIPVKPAMPRLPRRRFDRFGRRPRPLWRRPSHENRFDPEAADPGITLFMFPKPASWLGGSI
jgi:hypothetical protein